MPHARAAASFDPNAKTRRPNTVRRSTTAAVTARTIAIQTPGATSIQTFKSGGNRFSGLEHFTYEPTTSPWMADNVDSATRQRGFTGNPNLSFWEGHLDVGGPILRDKLWFFGAYNQFHLEQKISGIDPSAATDITDVTDPMLTIRP